MKIDKYIGLGVFFIILAIIIFFTDVLTPFIRPLTHLILMGSSKGKDILFFAILGIVLIISQLFEYDNCFKENKLFKKLYSLKISSIFKLNNNTYLKISLIIFVATAIFGIILELILRYQLGLSAFTIFVAMDNGASTTSILHSHVYKAVIGNIINNSLNSLSLSVPSGINTADALLKYVPSLANIIIIILPILFLTQLAALKNRLAPVRLFFTFTIACGLIGIFDGGLFTTACIGGIYGILFLYFDEVGFNYYFGKLFFQKAIVEKCKKKRIQMKEDPMFSYGTFKRFIPHLFLILIIILRISVSLLGSTPDYYEVNILNPEATLEQINNSLNDYSVISIQENNNVNNNNENNNANNNVNTNNNKNNSRVTVHISPDYNEMNLLNSLINSLEGKTQSFSLSWNFYSYLNSPQNERNSYD